MKKVIIKWIIFALIIMATCYIPGIKVENFAFAMLIAAVLTLVNIFIKPIIKFLAFPVNFITFGFANIFINWGILCGVSYLIPQYHIETLASGFLASLVIAIAYGILKKI